MRGTGKDEVKRRFDEESEADLRKRKGGRKDTREVGAREIETEIEIVTRIGLEMESEVDIRLAKKARGIPS